MRFGALFAGLLAVSSAASVGAQAPAAANPDDEIAKGLYLAGKAAFDAGRYQEAYDRFFESYEHSQRPALLYNLAVTLDRLRRDEEALSNYRGYLQEVPDAENRTEVENRIRALEAAANNRKREPIAPVVTPTLAVTATPTPAYDLDRSTTDEPPERGDSIFGKWWFWTGAGVVVTAVVVGVVVASSGDDVRDPKPGSDGMIVLTLTKAP